MPPVLFGLYPYFYGIDIYYIILLLPCILLASFASIKVNTTFKKYSKQRSLRNITGAEAAQRVLSANGVSNVRIERVSGKLTDHYDPKANVIRLSEDVYDSTSTAAIGVASHEAGHAVQYAKSYAPIKLRAAILPAVNIGSHLSIPLILIGVLLSSFGYYFPLLIEIGILCFSLTLVFQLVTLPVEFNASRRALSTISQVNLLTEEEQKGARKTLTAAAMTYVAAALVAAAQLLRLVLLTRRDD